MGPREEPSPLGCRRERLRRRSDACPRSLILPRLTHQAQPHGTHLLDHTLTFQERIAAGNEKIAAKAAAKSAARQAGAAAVPELAPAPEVYFFHPAKGLMEIPFS